MNKLIDKDHLSGSYGSCPPSKGWIGLKSIGKPKKSSITDKNRFCTTFMHIFGFSESLDECKISHYQLFRYSTTGERVLIIISTIFALASGLGISCLSVLIGLILNVMIQFEFKEELNNGTSNNFMHLTKERFKSNMTYYCGTIGLIGLLECFMVMFMTWAMNYTAEKQTNRIRNLLLRAVMKQEIGWFDTKTDNFSSQVGENLLKLQTGIGEKAVLTLLFFGVWITSLLISFAMGWELTLVSLVPMPLLVSASGVMSTVQAKFAHQELKAYEKANAIAEEALSAIRTVVAFGGEQKEIQRYNENLLGAKKLALRRGLATAVGLAMAYSTVFGSLGLTFWYGTKLVSENKRNSMYHYNAGIILTIAQNLIMGSIYLGQVLPFFEISSVAKAAASDIFKIIAQVPFIDSSSEKGVSLSKLRGEITFESVHFSYPSRKNVPVLKGLSFRVNVGETVALVGTSGCGKTTVLNLVQRFYDVDSGTVLIDGVNIKTLNVGWLRDNIGLVGQEPCLFSFSIRENIMISKEVSNLEMTEATRAANAHKFIMGMPMAYETQVGGKESQMSGGQKQRIAIARALVRNPKILLLDEATSALDTESESLVQEALDRASKGRTTVIIAHRLSTIRRANRIIVIDDGKLVEEGTHQELLDKKGHYYRLVSLQIDTSVYDASDEEVETEKNLQKLSRHKERKPSISSLSSILCGKPSHKKIKEVQQDVEVKNVVWETLKYNSPEKWYIIIGVIMAGLSGCAFTIYAYCYGTILEVYALKNSDEMVYRASTITLQFLGVGVACGVFTFMQVLLLTMSGEKLTMRLRSLAFASMMKQEVGWHDDKKNAVGILSSLLSNDAACVKGATGARLGIICSGHAMVGSGILMSFILSWELSIVLILAVPIVIVAMYYDHIFTHRQSSVEHLSKIHGNKIAVEALENIRTVASLHREEVLCTKYNDCFNDPSKTAILSSLFRSAIYGFCQSLTFLAFALGMYFGTNMMYNNQITYGQLFRILEAISTGSYIAAQTLSFTPDYQSAKVSASKLIRLIKRTPKIDSTREDGIRLKSFKGDVKFKRIKFNYPSRPDAFVLKNINFEVKPGMTVAIVGSSGCGKSTCIQLLQRFYDSNSGKLKIGSTVNKKLNTNWMRSQFSLVQQEPLLFGCSIAENIAYGAIDGNVTMEEIVRSAQDANIHKFISELPLGYDTPVGVGGNQLSGGQKQRIAIARALIRKPKLLLLDEATSSLDSENEKVVEKALEKARHGRSCIVIAHRLSTIQNADLIIAMKNGKIIEMGTHHELLEMQGFYHLLYKTQAGLKFNH